MAYKYTSDTFQISAIVAESAPNTPTTTTININLDSLSREILVIQMVDLDLSAPSLEAGFKTQLDLSLTDSNTGVSGLSNGQTIATANKTVLCGSGAGAGGIDAATSFSNQEPLFANMDDAPIFVSATDDLFLSIAGANNTAPGLGQCRIYARRARADADTYAAILTSQFNS